MNDIVIITVVYKSAELFFNDYIESLLGQTENFCLLLVNDGMDSAIIDNHRKHIDLIEIKGCSNPIANREIALNYVCENNFKVAIFADADDWFDFNRVFIIKKLLQDCDMVVNDIVLAEKKEQIIEKNIFSNRIKNYDNIYFEYIINKNCCGMSNTAVKIDYLRNVKIPKGIVAADWFVFSQCLMKDARAVFTSDTATYYRQYNGNVVGSSSLKNVLSLKNAVIAKKAHYECMKYYNPVFENLYKQFSNLEKKLNDNAFCAKYFKEMIKIAPAYPFWWEEARHYCQ